MHKLELENGFLFESNQEDTLISIRETLGVISPEDLVEIQTWLNARVMELIWQGYLPTDHLGD
jgi:hypothetical protein